MAHHDVVEFLSSPRALSSQLVDQGLAGGPRHEHRDNVSVGDVGQCIALPGEALNVLVKSLSQLLLAVLEVPWVSGAFVGALHFSHEYLLQV
jgi:hypothetical protein